MKNIKLSVLALSLVAGNVLADGTTPATAPVITPVVQSTPVVPTSPTAPAASTGYFASAKQGLGSAYNTVKNGLSTCVSTVAATPGATITYAQKNPIYFTAGALATVVAGVAAYKYRKQICAAVQNGWNKFCTLVNNNRGTTAAITAGALALVWAWKANKLPSLPSFSSKKVDAPATTPTK